MKSIYNKNLLVLGKGISGNSIAKFFGCKAYDIKDLEGCKQELCNFEYVYISPGIDLNSNPWLQDLIRLFGLKIKGEFDLLYEYNPQAIYIGVTGSTGKTTTVHMIKELFDQNRIHDYNFVGNQGIGVFDHKPDAKYHIMEMSSFQLERNMQLLRLDRGIITNIIPTHLNRHGTYDIYRNLKLKMLAKTPYKEQLFYAKSIEESLKLVGTNLGENAQWALSIMASLEFKEGDLSNFKPLPHRQEVLIDSEDLIVVNDSKATTDRAVSYCLRRFGPHKNKPLYLIIGNNPKTTFLTQELIEDLRFVDHLYIFGTKKEVWYEMFKPHVSSIAIFKTLQEIPIVKKGIVLFSPLGESFDQFSSYRERGEIFKSFYSLV